MHIVVKFNVNIILWNDGDIFLFNDEQYSIYVYT